MSLEPPELVALRRGLGRQLAASRRAAGIGQQQLARRTGYSRSSVAHAESGRQLLSRTFWQTADELVEANGALLAAFERLQAAQEDHERQKREAELVAAYAAAQARQVAVTPPQLQCQNGGELVMGPDSRLWRAWSPLSAPNSPLAWQDRCCT